MGTGDPPTIMPFLDGNRPNSDELTQPDGYVGVYGILGHDDVKTGNIALDDLRSIDRAQCEEHAIDPFLRNIKSPPAHQLIDQDKNSYSLISNGYYF